MEKNKCLRKLMDAVVVIRGELTTSASDYQGKERKMTKKTHFKVLFSVGYLIPPVLCRVTLESRVKRNISNTDCLYLNF